jgi:hypothetical protein
MLNKKTLKSLVILNFLDYLMSKSTTETNFNFNFNEKSLEAFTKEGLDPPHDVRSEIERIAKFKARFKEEKGKLQIIIKTMNRRAIITYDKTGKAVKKEFLTYRADYHGKDWLGNDIWIREHFHGQFKRPKFRTTMEMNYETGDHVPKKEYDGTVDVYTIELTDKNRKQIIEDIINKCNGSIIDQILFYGHFLNSPQGPSFRCNLYTYDQFINSSIEELERLGRKEGGPQGTCVPYKSKDKKQYMG